MLRRYSEFETLRRAIEADFSLLLSLPQKSWSSLSTAELERRAEGLSVFLHQALVTRPQLRNYAPLFCFLEGHHAFLEQCETVAGLGEQQVRRRLASLQGAYGTDNPSS